MVFSGKGKKWGRSSLTALAIAISFSMLLSLSSISLGLHRASEERFGESPRDIVISSQSLSPSIENSHEVANELSRDINLSAAMPILTILGKILFMEPGAGPISNGTHVDMISSGETETIGMVGIVPYLASPFLDEENELFIRSDILKFNDWFEETGDPFYESGSSGNWTGEMILDRTMMEKHDLRDGDMVYHVNSSGIVTSAFKVVGRLETSLVGSGLTSALLGGIAVVHLGELQYVSGYHSVMSPGGERKDLSTAIYIDIVQEKRSTEDQKSITLDLGARFPGLDITSKENRLYRIDEEVLVLEIFAVSVAVASISIGVLFLSSIMIIDVEDRRSDISIMRAIGISRRTIFLQTLKNSILISTMGAVVGLVPGYLGSKILGRYLQNLYGVNIQFSRFEPLVVIACMFFLFTLVSLFSLVPAIRSASISPKEGLRNYYNR